ncbi:MAG TPA: carboxypeptidase regulatory-like domain-containing protein [Kofleriaceae bacterium]|nr:carboxypeptidase regulatory-like domain-containing protein [Kofleriaceae bacterium]
MNRKLVAGSVAVVVGLVLVWFFWLRDRGDTKPPAKAGSARSSEITPAAPPADKPQDAPAPRGMAPKWALDLDREGPLTLEGQVIGPDGKGVPKAEVWLGSVPPRTAVAEDDGTFSFDKLVGRTYELAAKSGELIGGPIQYKLTDKSDPAVIRVVEAAAIQVTVVDEAKQPLAGVEVKSGFSIETTATTDAKGEAMLKPVSPGYAIVEANADGFARSTAFATVGSAGATARVTITMHKGYAISGRVIDETGKALDKVRVTVAGPRGFDWATMQAAAPKDPSAAITNDKGEFKIAAVAAGSHVLHATDGEHAPARSRTITVEDRAVSGVEITMKAGGVFAGTVVDAAGGPVPFASVRLAGAGEQMMMTAARQATTDEKGAFELRGVARTKLQARADSETAASKVLDVDLTEKLELRDVKLVLDVTGTIAGVVVDSAGAPIAEVQVNAFPDILSGASTDGIALAGMSSATTDGAGAFKITGLPDGSYRLWAARASGSMGGWGNQNTAAKVGDKNVRITLASPGGIKGTIAVDSVGAPKLAMVSVGWQAPTPAQDGKFELKELDPGTYDLTIRGADFATMVKRDVKVESGKTVDLGTITVYRGRKITGRVVDKRGKGVGGAQVKVGEMLFFSDDQKPNTEEDDPAEQLGGMRSTVTDEDGRFSIIGIAAKATSVAADHPTAGRSASVAVPEGATDPAPVTLALRGFGSITGKVVQKGKPLSGVSVTHTQKGAGAQISAVQTDDDGVFTMKKVPEGSVTLQAMQQKMMAMKSTTVTVQVTSGNETKVTIDVPVGQVTLTVTPKPAAGAKVDAAQLFLFSGAQVAANGKQLMDAFLAGGAQGMELWFGPGKPPVAFRELVPGSYSVCALPITGDMNDQQLMQRINENAAILKVYCKQVKVTPAPVEQTFSVELPSMDPLPAPAN